jgi:hypothetical protein
MLICLMQCNDLTNVQYSLSDILCSATSSGSQPERSLKVSVNPSSADQVDYDGLKTGIILLFRSDKIKLCSIIKVFSLLWLTVQALAV